MDNFLYLATFSGVIAMLFAFWKTSWINSQDEGTDRMKSIGSSIADGAMAFLKLSIVFWQFLFCCCFSARCCQRRKI